MTDEQNKNSIVMTTSDLSLNPSALGRGHEESSDMEDMEIPRAKLIQPTSGEVTEEDESQRRKPGIIINSITKEELGNIFIPIFKSTNFIRWNPRKKDDPNFDFAYEPGELIFSTSDRNDPRVLSGTKFGENGEAPRVTKYLNFLCFFTGQNYPLVLSFAKKSFKAGSRLNTMTKISGGDMFSSKYKISIKAEENAGTKYYVLDVSPSGKTSDEEYRICEIWWKEFRGKNIKVHLDEFTESTPSFSN